MYYFVELACVIAEVWMINWLLSGMHTHRDLPRWMTFFLYGIYSTVLTILSFVEDISFSRIIFNFTAIWMLGLIIFKSTPLRSLFSSLIMCVLAAFADVLLSTLFLHYGYDIQELMTFGPNRSVYLVATHIVIFALTGCIYILCPTSNEKIPFKFLVLVLPCWLCSALLCVILARQLLGDNSISPLYLYVLLGMLYTDILFVYQINKLSIQEREKQEWELAEHHYAMQQSYYDQFRIQQEETRALWHDIRKLLGAVKAEHSANSLFQIDEMVNNVACVVDVDNRVVSVILNEYAHITKEENIRLNLDVQVPNELFVTAVDLYILIGNTLENAIEACTMLPSEQRDIFLKIRTHNNILFYEIQNPIPPGHDKRPRGKLHGYGISNVRRCVEKYNGTVDIQQVSGNFHLIAHLNGG